MRSINIQSDIEAVLTQFARCIPDVFAEFDLSEIEVIFSGVDGVFDLVRILDDETELVIGEIVLDEDLVASFDIFEEEVTENEVFQA